MALAYGTNIGFVEEAPSADPSGQGTSTMDGRARALKDTSPATAAKIVEVGWWCNNGSEESNFEVGLYDDDSGSAGDLLEVERTNAKGTSAGWKSASVDWVISPETVYWIGVQLDDVATATNIDNQDLGSGGVMYEYLSGVATLPDPFSGIDGTTDYVVAIYAVWEAAAGGGVAFGGIYGKALSGSLGGRGV